MEAYQTRNRASNRMQKFIAFNMSADLYLGRRPYVVPWEKHRGLYEGGEGVHLQSNIYFSSFQPFLMVITLDVIPLQSHLDLKALHFERPSVFHSICLSYYDS